MSHSSTSNTIETSSTKNLVNSQLQNIVYSDTSSSALEDSDKEDSLTETNSSTSTEDKQIYKFSTKQEDYSPQTLKEWLNLAKILITRNENTDNKHIIAKKSEELQDFFYFLAIEYFSTDDYLVDFLKEKRCEFINNWKNVIVDCAQIFDCLIDLIDDIDIDHSFCIS